MNKVAPQKQCPPHQKQQHQSNGLLKRASPTASDDVCQNIVSACELKKDDGLMLQLQAELMEALRQKEDALLEIQKLQDRLRASEKTVKLLTTELRNFGQQSTNTNNDSQFETRRRSRRKKNERSRTNLMDEIKTSPSLPLGDGDTSGAMGSVTDSKLGLISGPESEPPAWHPDENNTGREDGENLIRIDERASKCMMKLKHDSVDDGDVGGVEVVMPKKRRILPKGENGERIHPKCTVCSKVCSNYSTLEQHMRLHTGEKPYKCTQCNKEFRLKFQLVQHVRTHIESKPYTCSVCGKGYGANSVLWVHMKTHSGVKPFQCSVCPKTFLQSAHLSQHLRTHTGHKPFQCSICSKTFKQKGHLVQHERIHSGERPFQCCTCGRNFSGSSHLNRHMKIHTGEKPYACCLCSMAFSEQAYLTRHMRTHMEEKPHACSVCQKGFRVKHNLIQHMRTHNKPMKGHISPSKSHDIVHCDDDNNNNIS